MQWNHAPCVSHHKNISQYRYIFSLLPVDRRNQIVAVHWASCSKPLKDSSHLSSCYQPVLWKNRTDSDAQEDSSSNRLVGHSSVAELSYHHKHHTHRLDVAWYRIFHGPNIHHCFELQGRPTPVKIAVHHFPIANQSDDRHLTATYTKQNDDKQKKGEMKWVRSSESMSLHECNSL